MSDYTGKLKLDGCIIRTDDGGIVCEVESWTPREVAERIVACANACKGIPTVRLHNAVLPVNFDGDGRSINLGVLHFLHHFRAVLKDNGHLQEASE